MTHTNPDEIDPAAWAERDTDAGTKPLIYAPGPDPDYERDVQVEAELLEADRQARAAIVRSGILEINRLFE